MHDARRFTQGSICRAKISKQPSSELSISTWSVSQTKAKYRRRHRSGSSLMNFKLLTYILRLLVLAVTSKPGGNLIGSIGLLSNVSQINLLPEEWTPTKSSTLST